MGQNGLQRGPKGSECGQKRANLYAQLGSKCLKMASARVKMGQNGSKCGPEGSKWPQNGLKYPKMAFSRPNLAKSSRRGSIQHTKLGAAETGTPQRRVLRLGSRFLPKSVHRVPPYPMYIGYPPTLCTLLDRNREPSRSTLR